MFDDIFSVGGQQLKDGVWAITKILVLYLVLPILGGGILGLNIFRFS